MKRTILDTSVLITQWNQRLVRKAIPLKQVTQPEVLEWALEIIRLHQTNKIVTPVRLEMLAGVQSQNELKLAEAFLREFTILDQGDISKEDWHKAEQIVQRVPREGIRRRLIDCLICAIARR